MLPDIQLLETELHFKTSRSGGSGGQHVNKVSSKVELDFDINASRFLTEDQKAILHSKLSSRITNEGILQLISQSERSQLRNKKVVLEKFYDLIEDAFKVQKKRKATKTPRAVKEKRLLAKKMKAEIKKFRRKDF